MRVYQFSKFSNQVSQSLALAAYRPAINQRLRDLAGLVNFGGQTIVVSAAAKTSILQAAGSNMTNATHIYEIGIGGHWRIFFAPSPGGSIIALLIGHLQGNVLQEP